MRRPPPPPGGGAGPPPIASGAKPSSTPALTPPDSLGILVLPVAGAPSPAADDIAQAMTSALQEADVPASTGASNRRSFRLAGRATALEAGDGRDAVIVSWTLHDADGRTLRSAETHTP